MNKELLEVFKNVNEWLKFAEAKNAMLIGFNGVLIVILSRVLMSPQQVIHPAILAYLIVVLLQLTCSSIIALVSFVPRLTIVRSTPTYQGPVNRWFFEYLKTLNKEQIVQEIAQYDTTGSATKGSTTTEGDEPTTLDLDLAEQIKQNSLIASEKYAHFEVAIWYTVSAIVTPFLWMIIAFMRYFRKED